MDVVGAIVPLRQVSAAVAGLEEVTSPSKKIRWAHKWAKEELEEVDLLGGLVMTS